MNEENSFMKEKIKEKPFYKKKWVQILCTTIVIAVIFGVISAFVFSKMSDWIEEKQAQEAMQDIEIPKDQPEEEVSVETETESITEQVIVEAELTLDEYEELYSQMRMVAGNVSKALVTVTAVNNDVDWFNEEYQNRGQCSGKRNTSFGINAAKGICGLSLSHTHFF